MLIEIFGQGGWVMWPILAASVVALGAVINRLAHVFQTWGNATRLVLRVLELVRRGELEQARVACAGSRVPAAAVLRAGHPHSPGARLAVLLHVRLRRSAGRGALPDRLGPAAHPASST